MKGFVSICMVGGALLLATACKDNAPGNGTAPGNEIAAGNSTAPAKAGINPVVDTCNTTLPPSPAVVTPAIAHSGLPCSLAFQGKVALEPLQEAFDFNSWLTFVALSAPAGGSSPGPDAPAAWQSWQDLGSLMLPDGAAPPPFGSSVPPPKICTGGPAGAPVLQMISKTPVTPTVSVAGQPLNTGPLIDQNGHYVRYQILVNEPMYDYIVANHLYSKAGQQAFTGTIAFPVGDTKKDSTSGTIGAIVVKASWMVLGPHDDPAKFHVTRAYVYTPPSTGVSESCKTETLGLVGIHIVHKTAGEPQWIWSTFEHVDNVPTAAKAGKPTNAAYHFYNPSCSAAKCPINKQPPQPWNASIDPFPDGFHSQIVRTTKYPPEALRSAALWNDQFQPALKGSVLANYELITTQWPTDAKNPTDPNGAPFPVYAANTTMETYVQGNVPQASSSCMACHGNATTTTGKESDFSFVLEKAH